MFNSLIFLTYLFEDRQHHCTSVELAKLTIRSLSIDCDKYRRIVCPPMIISSPMLQSFRAWPQDVQNNLRPPSAEIIEMEEKL